MKEHTLLARLKARGFEVSHDGKDYVAPCPCCQYWMTSLPSPAPPSDATAEDEVPCLRFRELSGGHCWTRCSAGCDDKWVYALLGKSYYASKTKPCEATTYCLSQNRERLTLVQRTAVERFLDEL